MSASNPSSDPTFGFLNVTDLGGGAYIGGYLILNTLGRPLEFHCTEPVKPNRAQQILYGATLEPYLFGEQIGQSLWGHCPLRPSLLVTDQIPMLALGAFVETPVVCLVLEDDVPPGYVAHRLGPNCIVVEECRAADRLRAQSEYDKALPDWRMDEPFQRIREAITELQKAA